MVDIGWLVPTIQRLAKTFRRYATNDLYCVASSNDTMVYIGVASSNNTMVDIG